MIDVTRESPIPLSVAARGVPNRAGGRGISVPTVWRWAQRGIRGVRLETVMIGGVRMTTDDALQRFYSATTAATDGRPLTTRTPAARERAIAAAERELAADGI